MLQSTVITVCKINEVKCTVIVQLKYDIHHCQSEKLFPILNNHTDMFSLPNYCPTLAVAYPGILFGCGRGSTNSVEHSGQRDLGRGGGNPLVRGSGGSCNLLQEISLHIVKLFLIFDNLILFMMTTNLFVIANVKQLRTGGSFRMLLPFFRAFLGCWCPKFSNF